MRKYLIAMVAILVIQGCKKSAKNSYSSNLQLSKEERMYEAMEHEIDRTIDHKLDRVPYERLYAAEKYYKEQELLRGKTSTALANIQWAERGPNNVGGRTRAIVFLSATKVLAAGVTGGLWVTDNIASSTPGWTPIGDFLSDNINISCIAQDPNSFGTLYAGTGEAFGSSMTGSGIYKSIDTGSTWTQLASTSFTGPSSNFSRIAKILVADDGNIYAATKGYFCNSNGGLMRSTNGGTSWTRIIGTNGTTCTNGIDLEGSDLEENDDGDLFFSSAGPGTNSHVYISNKGTHGVNVGASGNWSDITPTGSWQRMEMGVSRASGSGVIYVACQGASSNDVTGLYYSSNKGTTWASRSIPTICDQGSNSVYTRSQAWYDQVVEIDPANDNTVYIGGIDLLKSTNAGASFNQITTWATAWPSICSGSVPPSIHADQHALVFNPFTTNAALSGNDGSLYYSTNMNTTTPSWSSKESGYNTSQFYHIATHPTNGNYVLGGTQDNGSWKLNNNGLGSGSSASGGDGAYSHIHQSSPIYQSTQYVYNNYYLSSNGGTGFSQQSSSNTSTGRFINPSDMDDDNNIIWSAGNSNVLERRSGVNLGSLSRSTYTLAFNSNRLTALKVSPNNSTTLYVGDDEGYVYKIIGRNGTPSIAQTWLLPSSGSGYVSSIDVWENTAGTDDSILVTQSSYGVNSVYVTGNGTVASPTFTDIDDGTTLQDIPVRWGIFSKEGPDKIFIATDLGVLATDNISGGTTSWTMVNNGFLPRVRTDALVYDADGNLVAATHGRGIWETKEPCNASTPKLPTAAGTYTSTKAVQDGTNTCFCDANDNLLLVLDTNGTGAVVSSTGVQLQIGATTTTSWNNAGGIITNTDGGAIFNRKWEVTATTQPSSPVTVKYYFTDNEYTSVVSALAGLTTPTTVTSPSDLQFYKLTGGAAFADPHATGATGVILKNGATPSTTNWAYSSSRDDHISEFMVSSFSGGGGGGGGGNSALPIAAHSFTAKPHHGRTALLEWATASEQNNKGFEIMRSIDGRSYELIGWVSGSVNSSVKKEYRFVDQRIPISVKKVFYKYVQRDYDEGKYNSDVRVVSFRNNLEMVVFPNPTTDKVLIQYNGHIETIEMFNLDGNRVGSISRSKLLDISVYPAGTYILKIHTDEGEIIRRVSKL